MDAASRADRGRAWIEAFGVEEPWIEAFGVEESLQTTCAVPALSRCVQKFQQQGHRDFAHLSKSSVDSG
jgi:hypothetical protein